MSLRRPGGPGNRYLLVGQVEGTGRSRHRPDLHLDAVRQQGVGHSRVPGMGFTNHWFCSTSFSLFHPPSGVRTTSWVYLPPQ